MDPRSTLWRARRRLGRAILSAGRRLDPEDRATGPAPWVPPGHFYSPIPDWAELAPRADALFGPAPATLPDVELNLDRQLELLAAMGERVADRLYAPGDDRPVRYHPENRMFGQKSANALHLVLRVLAPRRIVEVGSGFSSAVMLDTDQHCLGQGTRLDFVEPYPARLEGLLAPGDRARCTIHAVPLERAPRAPFDALEAGDVLFVDSSHVLKTGNDLCRLLFEILPSLAGGVYVHFHDVLYPFEYPRRWVEEGRAWNEAYALRAFLAYNPRFSIQFWASYLFRCHRSALERVPEVSADGSSIWIRKAA